MKATRPASCRLHPRHLALCCALPVLHAALGGSALAQTTPDAGSLIRTPQAPAPETLPETEHGRLPTPPVPPAPPAQPSPPEASPPPEAARPPTTPPPLPETEAAPSAAPRKDAVRITVRSIRFSESTGKIDIASLHALTEDVIGKELDFTGLGELVARVNAHLKQSGYFLAQAWLPPQDVTEGHIEIALLGGRIDRRSDPVRITPATPAPLRIRPSKLDDILDAQIGDGEAPQAAAVERALHLMNDLPGVDVRARLESGSQPGSTRLDLDVAELPLLMPNLGLDNHGNRDTGTTQVQAGVMLRNPSGFGDQVDATGTRSRGLELLQFGYGLPLGGDGLRATLGITQLDYRIVTPLGAAARLEGEAHTQTLGLAYPFVRSRLQNLQGSLSYQRKTLFDDSSTGRLHDKSNDEWILSLSGDSMAPTGAEGTAGASMRYSAWNLSYASGKLSLDRLSSDATADASGYRTNGRWDKLGFGLLRLQDLGGNFSLLGRLSGQLAGKNLDSSEKFALGGPNAVRAYPNGEASGDSGWLTQLELRYEPPGGSRWGRVQWFAFVDAGGIELHHSTNNVAIATATGRNRYALLGSGLGLSITQPNNHSFRLVWARKHGSNPGRTSTGLDADGLNDRSRVWLQFSVFF